MPQRQYVQTLVILFLSLIASVDSQLPQLQTYLHVWSSVLSGIRNRTSLDGTSYLEKIYEEIQPSYGYASSTEMLRQRAEQLSSINVSADLAKLGVNTKCWSHTEMVLWSVVKRQKWALKMLDSMGKLPSGFMQGNLHFVGSYEECNSVQVTIAANYTGHPALYRPFEPKYCQILFPLQVVQEESFFSLPALQLGVCVPDSCTSKDLETLVNTGIHWLPFHSTRNYSATAYCETKLKFDGKAIFSLVAFSLFLALLILATLYHVTCNQDQPTQPKKSLVFDIDEQSARHDSSINDPGVAPPEFESPPPDNQEITDTVQLLPSENETSLLGRIFMCFSIYQNGTKLLKTDKTEGTLSCVHGVRFLSMTWVLIGHVYVFSFMAIRNPVIGIDIIKGFAFQAISNALVSVDSFFLLSGLLVSYSTLRALKANNGKINWFYFYIHRFWRLTPPFMLVMMLYIPLFRYMSHGPFWPSQGFEKDFCRNSWYYNLLYINNFLPTTAQDSCMGWSWYLANDMQFYWISPLLIIPLYKSAKLGHFVTFLFLVAHLVTTAVIAIVIDSPVSIAMGQNTDAFDKIYIKPYTRIGPYLIGILYGYHLYRNKSKKVLNGYISCVLWSMATISAVAVLYGLYNIMNGAIVSRGVSVFYITVNRTVWGICVGWVIYACCTGYGGFVNTILSWKALIPVSRLTYTAYLVHPIILFYYYFSQFYPLYASQINMVFLIFGVLCITFIVAFFVSMAFEAPMLGLEKLLMEKLRRRK